MTFIFSWRSVKRKTFLLFDPLNPFLQLLSKRNDMNNREKNYAQRCPLNCF